MTRAFVCRLLLLPCLARTRPRSRTFLRRCAPWRLAPDIGFWPRGAGEDKLVPSAWSMNPAFPALTPRRGRTLGRPPSGSRPTGSAGPLTVPALPGHQAGHVYRVSAWSRRPQASVYEYYPRASSRPHRPERRRDVGAVARAMAYYTPEGLDQERS